jgi:hypothetical protein
VVPVCNISICARPEYSRKGAGISVFQCARLFENDGGAVFMIFTGVKRARRAKTWIASDLDA